MGAAVVAAIAAAKRSSGRAAAGRARSNRVAMAQLAAACEGRALRFLANVDPVDVFRALEGLNPESTLVVVISKTFTTAETMLNAETVKSWILAH